MAPLKFFTFNLAVSRHIPCQIKTLEKFFSAKVICPRSIKLNIPIPIRDQTHYLQRTARINVNDIKNELNRLVSAGQRLYKGRFLLDGLLVISESNSNIIEISANPDFRPYPENRCESSARNVLRKIASITNGAPEESIKDLVEGDLRTCIKILAQDHPEEVKSAIYRHEFEPILVRQDGRSLSRILHTLVTGILKMEQLYSAGDISQLYHFLPASALSEIAKILSANKILITGKHCRDIHKTINHLKTQDKKQVQLIVNRAKEEILRSLMEPWEKIKKDFGLNLTEFHINPEIALDAGTLREAIMTLWNSRIPAILLPGYIDEIARDISEAAREKLLAQIEKSNLVENAKQPLLHILAEKDYIYVSMFSFTSPLFAAALLAARLRGTPVRVLMDKKESSQGSSQYNELIDLAHELARLHPDLPAFETRLFQGVQHQKNIILGSGVYITGSQNMTGRGLTQNLEDLIIVKNDPDSHFAKEREFMDLFSFTGSFIPFPQEIASQHWLQRAGLIGIKFKDRTPNPGEVDEIMRQFRMSIADFSKVRNILEIAKGKGFEIEYDFTRPFQPFMVGMDPLIAQFLTRFLDDVPLGFAFAPASTTGKFHPGTTSGLSGLIEHELIGCELVRMLCKILGRDDLRDRATAAFIAHDTYKEAHKNPDGTISPVRYNPAHGPLAEEKWNEAIEKSPAGEKQALIDRLEGAGLSIGQHMGDWNKPTPTPLLPTDPMIKMIVQLADVLASRKYLVIKHRAMQKMTDEEIINAMLNNSFTIEGEGLSSLADVLEVAAKLGYKINSYEDLPQHAQEMLRVAESLCDVYGDYKEVRLKDGVELTEQEKGRISKRNEVLNATILYAIIRYQDGIDAPKSDDRFAEWIGTAEKPGKLAVIHSDPETKLGKLVRLIQQVDEKLPTPFRAKLKPDDDPALQIIGLANCVMTAPGVDVLTKGKVLRGLSGVVEPGTVWTLRKFKAETEQKLIEQIQGLIFKNYRDEFSALVNEGLLSRINLRRKKPLTAIHPGIISALIDKFKEFGSILPSYIYDNFYRPLSSYFRDKLFERLREANNNEDIRKDLITEIENLTAPAEKAPTRLFDMIAKTALANGISSIDKLKEAVEQARDTKAILDYSYFKQIGKAVDNLSDKLSKPKEKIIIYGDYDVDGQTATAILVKTLRWIKAKNLSKTKYSEQAEKIAEETISAYLPHRLNEGYGINANALETIARRGYSTIVTVDCGIKARELVKRAKKMGIDFIVTDHHQPEPKDLPQDAVAILNPKHSLKELTAEELKALNIKDIKDHPAYNLPGAGVAYKLAKALLDKAGIDIKDSFQDSVGFAAIADIVNMEGENRAFARAALARLGTLRRNKGIGAVIKALRIENIDEEALAFLVAPLFNAAGRFGKAQLGLKLLMARSEKDAAGIVHELLPLLTERREIERLIMADVERNLDFDPEKDDGIIAAGEWHAGIIGLVASKLVTKYGVPAVTINIPPSSQFSPEKVAYGSMRSIKGVSAVTILSKANQRYMREVFEQLCESYGGYEKMTEFEIKKAKQIIFESNQLFEGFGGHEGAGGFKIKKENIPDFQRLYKEVSKSIVKGRRNKVVVAGKLKLEEIKGLSKEEIKIFKRFLAPFGAGFEQPKFELKANILSWQVMGRDQQHIKGLLEGGIPFVYYFGNQAWVKKILMQKEARLVVKVGIESFQGKEKVQFTVEDIKRAA